MDAPGRLAGDSALPVPSGRLPMDGLPAPGQERALGPGRGLLVVLGVMLAYALASLAALRLAQVSPQQAAPLFPAAGVALGAALTYGRWAVPGVLAGVVLASLLDWLLFQGQRTSLWLWLTLGTGAASQAALGAWLVRRWVPQPLLLDSVRGIARFFALGGPLACVVSALVSTLALHQAGLLAPRQHGPHAVTWWLGDTLGVLIATPIVLSLIGLPRPLWRPRRLTVGLPLAVLSLLLGLATWQAATWQARQLRDTFERDASAAASALANRLREPSQALAATRGLFLGSDEVDRKEFAAATAWWLGSESPLQALGYAQLVARTDLARFEAHVRAGGAPNYKVFDRLDAPPGLVAQDTQVLAIRMIEPLQPNAPALGVNILSVPAARAALTTAAQTGQPVATGGFRLTQAQGDETGVVVYQPLFGAAVASSAAAGPLPSHLQGVVFATLRVQPLLDAARAGAPPYLRWCLQDATPKAARPALAGGPGCAKVATGSLAHTLDLHFGERQWKLTLQAAAMDVPGARRADAALMAIVALMGAAALGALLLLVTGRALRIEQAVSERTADLWHEVKERERTEAALRGSEQRQRAILEQLPLGVVLADDSGQLHDANPKLRAMVGQDLRTLLPKSLVELVHPDDRAGLLRRLAVLRRGDQAVLQQRLRLLQADGSALWAQVGLTLLRTEGDGALRVLGTFEDITEHLKLAEAVRARDAAEAANQAKSDFVSRMSHELRTPLNAMLGFAQLLDLDNRPALAKHQSEWTAQIQQAGWHLLHMINDTLDLARIESGAVRLDISSVDLHALLQASVAMVHNDAAQRDIQVSLQLAEDTPAVRGDATRVKQILTNLLSNAVKYNRPGGSVSVHTALADEDAVALTVQDSGLGMSEVQLAELFQPFNRLGREHSGTEGTGIGLVIAKRLAELMGGHLRATSVEGHGSTFTLTLPRAQPAERPAQPDGPPPGPALDYHRRIVHYVEDNETNVEVMRGVLSQRPQVQLSVSTAGLDALVAILRQRPSLILLDMHLPDIDGLELLRHLKANPEVAGIPVVAVSADATTARIEEAFAAGAVDYVTKPVNVPGFLALVDRLLDEQETAWG